MSCDSRRKKGWGVFSGSTVPSAPAGSARWEKQRRDSAMAVERLGGGSMEKLEERLERTFQTAKNRAQQNPGITKYMQPGDTQDAAYVLRTVQRSGVELPSHATPRPGEGDEEKLQRYLWQIHDKPTLYAYAEVGKALRAAAGNDPIRGIAADIVRTDPAVSPRDIAGLERDLRFPSTGDTYTDDTERSGYMHVPIHDHEAVRRATRLGDREREKTQALRDARPYLPPTFDYHYPNLRDGGSYLRVRMDDPSDAAEMAAFWKTYHWVVRGEGTPPRIPEPLTPLSGKKPSPAKASMATTP